MSKRIPPDRLFCVCRLCGEDYSDKHTPKASLARHLRFQHSERYSDYESVTTGYMTEVILNNKRPKCANPECRKDVTVKGFEYISRYCSSVCSSRHQHLMGGDFTNPSKVAECNRRRWQDPAFKARVKASHNREENKDRRSEVAKAYWADPTTRESRSRGHKDWWEEARKDREFMTRRSETSSRTATRLLQEHTNFGYGNANKHGKTFVYRGLKFRSSWEVALAKKLDTLGLDWEYEPKSFVLRSGVRYTPDFYLPQIKLWLEVKPRKMADSRCREKLRCVQEHTKQLAKFIDLEGIQNLDPGAMVGYFERLGFRPPKFLAKFTQG